MVGPLGPTVYSPTSGALVEQSAGGSWSVAKAFLQHWAEELERLLATCGEEVRRVGEERDRLWRELDKARKEWDLAYWAREHHILLNGASAALGSIHDGLARMPRDLLPELRQGVMQMGHLLAGHRQRVTADPGAWWEVAMDMAEPLPGHPKVLATVVAQLEVDLVGRIAEVDSEKEG
ncbi:hypothetical protein C0989_006078, partial [Termitomyces sp. Mn162]